MPTTAIKQNVFHSRISGHIEVNESTYYTVCELLNVQQKALLLMANCSTCAFLETGKIKTHSGKDDSSQVYRARGMLSREHVFVSHPQKALCFTFLL